MSSTPPFAQCVYSAMVISVVQKGRYAEPAADFTMRLCRVSGPNDQSLNSVVPSQSVMELAV